MEKIELIVYSSGKTEFKSTFIKDQYLGELKFMPYRLLNFEQVMNLLKLLSCQKLKLTIEKEE